VVSATDPVPFVVAMTTVALAAAAASIVPALRASRVHPMVALREE
jgi:ABC-type lipoprotein release transport system permease subunit